MSASRFTVVGAHSGVLYGVSVETEEAIGLLGGHGPGDKRLERALTGLGNGDTLNVGNQYGQINYGARPAGVNVTRVA